MCLCLFLNIVMWLGAPENNGALILRMHDTIEVLLRYTNYWQKIFLNDETS